MRKLALPLTRLFLLVGLLLSACGGSAAPSTQVHTLTLGEDERTYHVYLPPSYDGSTPTPVVFVFHGSEGNPEFMIRKFQPGLDDYGWIGVFPQGLARPGVESGGTWNGAHCCGWAHNNGSDDIAFFEAMYDEVINDQNVDAARVYVAGNGSGAIFAHTLAAALTERFAALADYGGTIGGQYGETGSELLPPTPASPLSALIIHGELDEVILYDGGVSPENAPDKKQRDPRIDISAARTAAFWAAAAGCDPQPVRPETMRGKVLADSYENCTAGIEVVLVTLTEGLHAFPFSDEYGIDIPRLMLEFFAGHILP